MAFQFMCPRGHLLQAEESQAGQQCQCPECGVLMLIPSPTGEDSAEDAPEPPSPEPAAPEPSAGEDFPAFQAAPDFSAVGGIGPPQEGIEPVQLPSQTPKTLHIPCPNGHVLETPEDMVGQDALCPFCNAQFRLRYDDSLEHRRERELEEERRQARAARAWLNWSIVTAAIVILGVILLFAISASR
ncbi:MAG: hypothetical protein ACOCWL_01730 [Thermoguttaceae bacterium]